MTIVLDSSALLAYLQGEPGEEIVDGVVRVGDIEFKLGRSSSEVARVRSRS